MLKTELGIRSIKSEIKDLEEEYFKYAFGPRCGNIGNIVIANHINNKIKKLRRKIKLELLKC